MQRLAPGGIIVIRQGGGGGALLARAPQAVTEGFVVRVLEDVQVLAACFAAMGGDGTVAGCCRVKPSLRSAEAAFLAHLDRTTLADGMLRAGSTPGWVAVAGLKCRGILICGKDTGGRAGHQERLDPPRQG